MRNYHSHVGVLYARIYSPPSVLAPTLRSRIQVSAAENSGKSQKCDLLRARDSPTLSFSWRRPNTERVRERGFSRLPTHAERLMKQSHLLHVTAPLSLSLYFLSISTSISLTFFPSLKRTPRIIDTPRRSVSSSSRL